MLDSPKCYVKVYVVGNKKQIKGKEYREFFVGRNFYNPALPLS